jgi:hypothetical protein
MRSLASLFAALVCAALPAFGSDRVGAPSGADFYTFESTQGTIKLKKGETGSARLAITPKAGGHVSPDAPISVLLTGGPALDLPKAKLTRTDGKPTAAGEGIELSLPFTAKTSGTDELKATFTFYICHADLCERQQKVVSFPVSIE